jgi:hypothetical protein
MTDDHDCPKCGSPLSHDDNACPPYFCAVCVGKPREIAIFGYLDRAIRKVPDHMQGKIRGYVLHGIPPGGFLRAVLENNLLNAASQGDDRNRLALLEWAGVLENLPRNIWGSVQAVDRHVEQHRPA